LQGYKARRRSKWLLMWFLVLEAVTVAALSQTCRGPQGLEAKVRLDPSARTWGALGGWFGEHHDFACAAESFRSALQLDPNSANMHYFLGLTLYSSGRVDEAVRELRQSTILDPNNLQAQLALGVALHQQGRIAEAESVWEDALSIDPNSVAALDWLAKARIADGQFGAAIQLLSTAPPDEDLVLDRALAYSQAGQFVQASKALESALSAEPQSLRLSSALATVYVQSHRYQDATVLMRRALAASPNDYSTQLLYLRLLVLQDDDRECTTACSKASERAPTEF